MHSSRLILLAFLVAATVSTSLLATTARANCGPSVSRYGKCFYKGDLLFCGACALKEPGGAISGCDRCGAGYLCKSKNCAVLKRCADQYSCDLCGCSWGRPTGFTRQRPDGARRPKGPGINPSEKRND